MHRIPVPMVQNPLDGVFPDFSLFGVEFDNIWIKIAGLIWAALILWAVISIFMAIGRLISASSDRNPAAYGDATKSLVKAAISFGAILCVGVIVGILISLFQQ